MANQVAGLLPRCLAPVAPLLPAGVPIERFLFDGVARSLSYGCCSIEMLTVEVLPEAARPTRLVAMPGIDAGAKTTEPSTAEVAVEACVASSAPCLQTT